LIISKRNVLLQSYIECKRWKMQSINKMEKKRIFNFGGWFILNLVLPFCLPIVCVMIYCGSDLSHFTLRQILEAIYYNGTYLFLGFTLILSLFSDYGSIEKKSYKSTIGTLLFVLIILAGFYPSVLDLSMSLEKKPYLDLKNNSSMFLLFVIVAVIYASVEKWSILKVKK